MRRRGLLVVVLGVFRGLGVAEGTVDKPAALHVLTFDALGVDAQQNLNAVSRPFGDEGRRHPAFNQVETAVCRRS